MVRYKMDGYIRTKLTKENHDAEDKHIAVFKQIGKELNLPDLDIKSIEYGRRYYDGEKNCLRTWNWELFDAKLNQIPLDSKIPPSYFGVDYTLFSE